MVQLVVEAFKHLIQMERFANNKNVLLDSTEHTFMFYCSNLLLMVVFDF